MRASLLGGAVALASLAFASGAGDAHAGHPLLPRALTITAGSRTFRIERNGRVRRVAATRLPFPHDAAWFPTTDAWFAIRHRHLVIGQWGATLWRSRAQFPSHFSLDVVIVKGHSIAFAYGIGAGQRLYVAHVGGAERLVAHGEFPLGWTSGGFFTYRFKGRQLRLRADTGALLETVIGHPLEYAYDPHGQSLDFVAHQTLLQTRGAVTHQVVSLARLGLLANSSLMTQPLGDGLIELLEGSHLVVLRPDGSIFGTAHLTRDRTGLEAPDSPLAVSPNGRAVAFSVPYVLRAAQPDPAHGAARGALDLESVYVLRAGARTAAPVHTERVQFAPCLSGANLEWDGRWLVFSAGTERPAVIDTAG